MPEVHFRVRWPDATTQRCTSPSRAIETELCAGSRYPAAELLRRARAGLEAASERVRERYGFACTAAAAQLEALDEAVARFGPGELCTIETMGREAPRPAFPAPDALDGHRDVVVVGGGQAGLSMSWWLSRRGIDHVVLERDRVAHTWRDQRWDAFCLVTPNWQCRLPGHPYAGDDPDGFMVRDEILEYVQGYAAAQRPPLHEGVAVEAVEAGDDGGFVVRTSHGELTAGQVVLAVGGYHVPVLPSAAQRLPDRVTSLHSSAYRNPSSLPDGAVLVVGSGQSGAQIAEDLHVAGREVHLCVGSAPRVARFYRGRDVVAWLSDIGHYDMPITEHPQGLAARREANHYVTGRDGGHDIDLRRFALEGMRLHGRLAGADGSRLAIAGDLRANLDAADATCERIKDTVDRWIDAQGIDAPTEPRYAAPWSPGVEADADGQLDLDAEGISTVIWATGFRSDWSWVHLPAFDGSGYPTHDRGVTTVPGLHVIGLPWLHTWGSGRFAGIARDAEHLGGVIAARAEGRRGVADASMIA